MEHLIRRMLGSHIELVMSAARDLWPAIVDRGQLETALLNLAVNARDAMPDGGRLSIEIGNAELDDAYAGVNPDVSPGEYVMIAVGDTGTGMSPDVAARAFEPFFTTKEAGRGTGLGLSMVYGFAKQSAGHVKIYSEPEIGTVVRLYLPRSDAPEAEVAPSHSAAAALPTGTETILLVEDDGLVRAHTENQLTLLGYRVIAAADASEAIDRVGAGLAPDLLLTDVVMPGMNGRQLAAHVQQLLPETKVLFISGYTHGVMAARQDTPIPPGQLLSKPFRRRDLAVRVREILDAPQAPE
jgi:CheY-like chemotaxis protein